MIRKDLTQTVPNSQSYCSNCPKAPMISTVEQHLFFYGADRQEFPTTKEQAEIILLFNLSYLPCVIRLQFASDIGRILWKAGEGLVNKRAFMKFLKYHDVPAQAVHGNAIFFPKYKTEGTAVNNYVVFHDDGSVTVKPQHRKFTVDVRFYESRHFYLKLSRYFSLPALEVVTRL
ncbi:hypothetical protein [Chitinophaga vietnamensis]|uniref:hypothetical protein n=1 Tax=Chitinophaga vietnamensis TaxID=2593957 RepID=UPI001177CC93|nr:hypothetical protein [Chitinophaga vietnamensis]